MTGKKLAEYRQQLAGKDAAEILAWSLHEFDNDRVILASSFSIEDQVLSHMLCKIDLSARIFTLDTGRQFQETYDVMQRSMDKFGLRYEVCAPAAEDLAALLADAGPNAMYQSLAKREACCAVRKLRPLAKVMQTVDAWICGLRRDQAMTRKDLEIIEWNIQPGKYKISPLINWSEAEVWRYIKENGIPYNALYDHGFRSIGCAPCTRPTGSDEDIRSGRWWWEAPEHKECGLHRR